MFSDKQDITRKLSRTAMVIGLGGALMFGAGSAMADGSKASEMESSDFSKWAEQQMQTLDHKWDEVQRDAASVSEDASEEIKENWNALVAQVKEERQESADALAEMKSGAEENWDELSEATEDAIDEFAESIEDAKNEMSGDNA